MLDKIIDAKNNKQPLVFEKYQMSEISWEDVVSYIYKESVIPHESLSEKVKRVNNLDKIDSIGSIQIQSKLWLSPHNNNLFDDFKGVSELLYKLNDSKDNSHCHYYNKGQHDCDSSWHFQGIRISLSNRHVPDHHDPYDIFYWQVVGTSFWKIDNDITYTLNPGDLLYLPLENSHQVWCDGPRAGILIDNLNKMI